MATFLRVYNSFDEINTDHIVNTSVSSESLIAHMTNGESFRLNATSSQLTLSAARFVPVQGYSLWCLYTNGEKPFSHPVIGLYVNDCARHCGLVGVLLYNGNVHMMGAYVTSPNYEDALQLPDGIVDVCGDTFADVSDWLAYLAEQKTKGAQS